MKQKTKLKIDKLIGQIFSIRTWLYLLAGTNSALIGWFLGQIILTDLKLLKNLPELVLFPFVAISLAIGLVLNEILISNPTRLGLCWLKARVSIAIAFGLGLSIGLIAGLVYQIILIPQNPIPVPVIRIIGWLIIGLAVGLAEGISWYWRSVEAGDRKRFVQRRNASVAGAMTISFIAAIIFELIYSTLKETISNFKYIQDPLGFSLLGLLLGLILSITTSPSYLAALRAGTGFEFLGEEAANQNGRIPPTIDTQFLKFVSMGADDFEEIQEGLSIQLPSEGKCIIGNPDNKGAHIRLPGLVPMIAYIYIEDRQIFLKPNGQNYKDIAHNGEELTDSRQITLKHNDLITFSVAPPKNDEELEMPSPQKIYRFVYYNRFLDPQA